MLALYLCSPLYGLEKSELVGEWHVSSTGGDEGVFFETDEIIHYKSDGTYSSEGVGFLRLVEGHSLAVTFSGPSSGTWVLENDKLRTTTSDMDIELFMCNLEGLTKSAMEKELAETKDEVDVSIFKGLKNGVYLFEGDEGVTSSLTKIKGNKRSSSNVGLKQKETLRFRRASLIVTKNFQFKVVGSLPLSSKSTLRKENEVLNQLVSIYAAVIWVSMEENVVSSDRIQTLMKHYGVNAIASEKVSEILATDRSKAKKLYINDIGWMMENLWALSWAMGFDISPNINDEMLGAEVFEPMLKHLSALWKTKKTRVKTVKIRTRAEIQQLEDLFYCAHNAVRSAQTGHKGAIPEGFHPVQHGGIIHEKRHALTWILSPKVKWDDTDLGT